MKRLVVGCLLGIAFIFSAARSSLEAAPLEPSVLSHFVPSAIAPGETVILQAQGSQLHDAVSLWTNIPGAVCTLEPDPKPADSKAPAAKDAKPAAPPKPDPSRARFQIKLPPGTTPGIYGARVVTAHGTSNLRLIMVDDLPTDYEKNTNKTIATAQPLKAPIAIDGVYEAETFDYYKIHAEAGERLSVEVVARRLGFALDPVLRLLDTAGHELAYADDDESSGVDGRFTYRFQKAGDYIIELRDIRYAGSATYRYRLRLGDFPLLGAPYPMGAQAGTKSAVQAVGADVGKLEPIKLDVPRDVAGGQVPLAAKYTAGQGSGLTTLAVAAGAEQVEVEPNNELAAATTVNASGAINGRFDNPKDRDYYRFTAKKGDKLRFSGRTRRLNSPTDLYLRLLSADGKTLVENDDLGVEESSLDYTVPADGTFILSAEELLRRGGPQFVYRIEIGQAAPGFTLALDVEKLDIPRGGVGKTKVTAVRSGYTGPIHFRITGTGTDKFQAEGIIPEAKLDIPLLITVPESLVPGTLLQARIVGEAVPAKGNEKTAEGMSPTTALIAPPLAKLFGGLTNPPAALVDQLSIFIGDPIGELLKLSAATKAIVLAQPSGKASLPIKIEKLGKFDDAITLTVEGLPAGVTAAPVTIAKGKAEGTIEFVGSDKALAAAAQPIRVIASATYLDQPKKTTLADLTLRIDGKKIEPAKEAPKPTAATKPTDTKTAETKKPDVPKKAEAPKPVAATTPAKETAVKVEPKK
ncbi:MAG: hypothetical protein K8U03_08035 [Planctomycetia bacterium]|nr:hypothetical protein [Planctomycetia bacterium]